MRRILFLGTLVPFFVMLFATSSFGTAFAASSSHTPYFKPASPTIDVTGTWNFTTTDPNYPSFTLIIRQNGTTLRGHDGSGEPLRGAVNGQRIRFFVKGVSSEDDYNGHGMIGPKGLHMSGNFADGFGGTGTFTAVKTG